MYLFYLSFVFICQIHFVYLLHLLLNMPEMAHDWFDKSIVLYSILFILDTENHFEIFTTSLISLVIYSFYEV